MFGRVGRAAARVAGPARVRAAGVLGVYRPAVIAGVAAVGMGSAGVASGGAVARTADGRTVSAMAEAVDGVMQWGQREQRRYLTLPGRVLVVVTGEAVLVHGWTVRGAERRIATWPRGSFTAETVHEFGRIGVRIVVAGGLIAVLTGPRGIGHRRVAPTVHALLAAARREPDQTA